MGLLPLIVLLVTFNVPATESCNCVSMPPSVLPLIVLLMMFVVVEEAPLTTPKYSLSLIVVPMTSSVP